MNGPLVSRMVKGLPCDECRKPAETMARDDTGRFPVCSGCAKRIESAK